MARDPASLHEIEKRASARLKSKGLQVEEFDLGHFPENVRALAVNVGVEMGRGFSEIAKDTYQGAVVLRLILVGKVLRTGDETSRREKTLPLVEKIIEILLLQDLNLQIKPLRLNDFRYRTAPEAFADGFIVWEILFETDMNFERVDDEEEVDLEQIWIDYFLQDTIPEELENPDASDLVDYTN